MKLTKYLKAAAALVVAATALAGCKFEGTKIDFKDYEYNAYAVTNNKVATPAEIVHYTPYITKADAKTEIDFTIVSRAYLDEKSIDAAVNAYIVDNASAVNLPYAKGAVLTKTLRRVVKTEYTTGYIDGSGEWWDQTSAKCVVTQVYYYVDTSSVTKNYIAFIVDATKLKEKTGKLVLNTNDNEKCGEESDSLIAYIKVYTKADDSATDSLTTGHRKEDYAPTFSLNATGTEETNTESKHTGVIIYYVTAPSTIGADGSDVYGDGFAAELGKMYTFLYFPIGAKEWNKAALVWTYDETNYRYEAKSPVIEYGTKYRLLIKDNNALEFPALSTYAGHTSRISWQKNTDEWESSTYTYFWFTAEPGYVYNVPDNNESITDPTDWSEQQIKILDGSNSFAGNQDIVIDYEIYNSNKVIFKLDDNYTTDTYNLRFGTTDGFVITDIKGNIIKTKTPVVYDEDEKGVKAVMIEVDNAYVDLTKTYTSGGNTYNYYTFWVGEKTTLKANAKYANQLKFGCPAVATQYGPAGYVKLTD